MTQKQSFSVGNCFLTAVHSTSSPLMPSYQSFSAYFALRRVHHELSRSLGIKPHIFSIHPASGQKPSAPSISRLPNNSVAGYNHRTTPAGDMRGNCRKQYHRACNITPFASLHGMGFFTQRTRARHVVPLPHVNIFCFCF